MANRSWHTEEKIRLLLTDISGNGNRYLRRNPSGNFRFVRGAAKHLMAKYDLPKQTFYRLTRRMTEASERLAKTIPGDYFGLGDRPGKDRDYEGWQLGPQRWRKGNGGSKRTGTGSRIKNAEWKPKAPSEDEAAAMLRAKPLISQLLDQAVDIWALASAKRKEWLDILWGAGVRHPECRISLLIDLDRIDTEATRAQPAEDMRQVWQTFREWAG